MASQPRANAKALRRRLIAANVCWLAKSAGKGSVSKDEVVRATRIKNDGMGLIEAQDGYVRE